MGRTYRQLSLEDRCSIARLHEAGQSKRQIAAALDRSPSTIAREMKRNPCAGKPGYGPVYAAEQAWARRWRGSRLERRPELRQDVLERLARGYSPEQVAGRLAREQGHPVLCAESIYRFLYAQIRRTDDTNWRHFLPCARYKRGRRKPRGSRSPMRLIPHRTPLSERPGSVDRRSDYGHWEADLMLFSKPGGLLLIAQERASRLLLATRLPSKAARPILHQLQADFASLPAALRQSVTFDNGAEFTHHHQLGSSLNIQTYFCDRHSPWQKGGIENAIGRLRRSMPRTADIAKLLPGDVRRLTAQYNNTPRKCLGYQTPAEIFTLQLLHFKCESTPSLRSG